MENSYKNYRVKIGGQMFPSLNQSNACVCWALQVTDVYLTVHRTTKEDGLGYDDDETDSRSESDLSTSEDKDSAEDGIPVSATLGDGVDLLWNRIQEKVLQATGNKHIVFTVPTDGPQLR